jgi:hypothetical protein
MRMTLKIATLILTLVLWGNVAIASAPTYSADSLYNVANSYARAGKLGLAVLNYERASPICTTCVLLQAYLNSHTAASSVLPKVPALPSQPGSGFLVSF